MRSAVIFTAAAAFAGLSLAAPVQQASSLEKRYSGDATYYYQNGNAGSCGTYSSDDDYVAAISSDMNPSSHCGQKIKVTREDTGKSVTVTARDTCPTCNDKSLDLSVAAFKAIASESEGMVPISWSFVDDYEKRDLQKRYNGQATFYYQNGNAGSCGNVNSDSSYIAAITPEMDPGSHCGDKLKVTNKATGASTYVTVQDTCPTCSSQGIDLSKAAFDAIGSEEQGVLDVDYEWA